MRTKIVIALGIVYAVWGSTYLAIAVADRTLPPLLMLAVRFGLAGVILYGWSLRRGDVPRAEHDPQVVGSWPDPDVLHARRPPPVSPRRPRDVPRPLRP